MILPDLTKKIPSDPKSYTRYRQLQAAVYILSFFVAVYLAFIIIFPTQYFSFSFPNPNSTQNTVINPRDSDGNFADRGRITGETGMFFDTAIPGNYSQARIVITLDKKSEIPENLNLSVRKSYQAFFYPEGEMLDDATTDENPDKLTDGSLVSYGNSAYILSGNFMYPIDSVETYNTSGFNWNDLTPVSSDRLSAYEKGKLFTLRSPHPDGTIMADENNQWYMIKDGKKHPLSFSAFSSIKRNPVLVSSQSLETFENCRMEKNTLSLRSFSCSVPLDKFRSLLGKDYEFRLVSDNDIKLETIEARFETKSNWENVKLAAIDILTRIKRNYVGETPQN